MTRALAVHRAGRLDEAAALYRQVLERSPDHPDALHLSGLIAFQQGRPDEALVLMDRALARAPRLAPCHVNRGNALWALGRDDAAVAAFRRALALEPENVPALANLGNAFLDRGRVDAAVPPLRRALALDPDHVEALHNLGNALTWLGRAEEARAAHDRALARRPGDARLRWNRALSRLTLGDLAAGFAEAEWGFAGGARRPASRTGEPRWSPGAGRTGGTTLLYADQGYGDTVQFVRYAPLVAATGRRVVLEVQPPLKALLEGLEGVAVVVARGVDPLPPLDDGCPLASLPAAFGTTAETIPARVPYVTVPTARTAAWRQRLGPADGRLRVGLVWAGRSGHDDPAQARIDRRRSIEPSRLAPLVMVAGCRFVSLQVPDSDNGADRLGIEDPTGAIADFADTAAIVDTLDLVVTVDTAVAHLAGALGRPVWVLSRFDGDWRWGLERDDCPWYPTLRLFRQPRPGDWASVLVRVGDALTALATSPPADRRSR